MREDTTGRGKGGDVWMGKREGRTHEHSVNGAHVCAYVCIWGKVS